MSALTITATPTPVAVTPPALPPAQTAPQLYRLSVAQYHEMGRLAILTENDRVELLEGLLVEKMTIYPPHRWSVRKLYKALGRTVPPGWFEDSQQPITLDDSEPEPDGMVIRGDPDQYSGRHPGPEEVGLVAEVADSSLDEDRGRTKRIFARANIPVYWIVNLVDRQVEVYTHPSGPADDPDYRQRQDFGPADTVPLILDGQEVARIPVSELLP